MMSVIVAGVLIAGIGATLLVVEHRAPGKIAAAIDKVRAWFARKDAQ